MPKRFRLPLSLVCLLVGAAVLVLYLVADSPPVTAGIFIGTYGGAALAIGYGLWRYRPGFRTPWILACTAQFLWMVSWVFWHGHILSNGGVPAAPDNSINFLFHPSYLITAVAVILIVRRLDASIVGPLDVAILASATFVFAWSHLLEAYATHSSLPITGQSVQIASGVLDVLILAAVIRLLTAPGRRNVVQFLVAASALAWVATDVLWNASTQLGFYTPGTWADSGAVLCPVLIGAAALSPKMASAFEPVSGGSRRPGLKPLFVLLAAALLGPLDLVAEVMAGNVHKIDLLPVVAATALVSLLVLLRLAAILRSEGRFAELRVVRERVLAAEQSARIESDTARAALEGQNERLRELDRMKDDFVASVSHELRTPLTSIQGYLELVLDGEAGEVTAEARRFLSVVARNVGRLERVVGDLLFVAQATAGMIAFESSPVDLRELAREAVEAARPHAMEKGVELRGECEAVPQLEADGARLGQVLDNLLSNAVKFTPAGGHVLLRTSARPGQALIEVVDDGMGIPPEEQARLFERFFRTESATNAAIQGTGLGLGIVQAIVTAHGGEVSVDSEVGRGTTVRVLLPAAATHKVAA
jgi:signal transduction histidine kinase